MALYNSIQDYSKGSTEDYMIFCLSKDFLAVQVEKVTEVLPFQEITQVPNSSEDVLGIFNLRGEILTLVDLGKHFSQPVDLNISPAIIVFVMEYLSRQIQFAVPVKNIQGVVKVKSSEISKIPEIGKNMNSELMTGGINFENQFVLILDIEKFISKSLEKTNKAAYGI